MRCVLYLPIVLLIALNSRVVAQIDTVELKNGDVLKGTVVECVPQVHLKMELPGGSKLTILFSDIIRWAHQASAPAISEIDADRIKEQRLSQYYRERKNQATAVFLSLLLSSAGHAYADNWGRGILFTVGRLGCALIIIMANNDPTSKSERSSWTTIGSIGLIGMIIYEAIDAADQVDEYNQSLYSSLMNLSIQTNSGHYRLNYSINF